jgi:hypothetical protein
VEEEESITAKVQRSPHIVTRRIPACLNGLRTATVGSYTHTRFLEGYHGPRVQHREATDKGSQLNICHWTKAKPQMTHDILSTDEIPFIAIGSYTLDQELPFVAP